MGGGRLNLCECIGNRVVHLLSAWGVAMGKLQAFTPVQPPPLWPLMQALFLYFETSEAIVPMDKRIRAFNQDMHGEHISVPKSVKTLCSKEGQLLHNLCSVSRPGTSSLSL